MARYFIYLIIPLCLDNGYSQNIWEPTSGPQSLDASDFAIASNGGLVLSVKSDGIYFSNDEGLSWQKNANGLDHPDSYATSLSSGANGIVYAIVDDYLYRFEKNSGIWENTGNRFVQVSKVIVDKKGSVFVLSDSLQVSLFISKDGGYSFDTILNNPKIRDLKAFSINGYDNNYVLVAGNVKSDLYRVSDNGAVVTKIYSASVTDPQMIWDDDGFVFMISSNAEIIRMDSLGKNLSYITWSPYILFRIFKKENGRLLLLTYDGDYESTDTGVNWTKVNSNYYKEGSQDPNYYFDGNTVYLLNKRCISNGLYKTVDEGHNWSEFGNLFSNPIINGLFANLSGYVFSSSFDCYDSRYFYTMDKGINWKNINIPVSEFGGYSILSNKRGDLFINSNSKIFKSDDYGRTWYPITIFNNIDLYNLTGDNKNLLFASGGSFMNLGYFSNDGGSNWFIPYFHNQQISSDLQSLYEHPDGTIFSIDDIFYGGLGYSNDRGMNWDTSGIHFDYFYSSCMTKSGLIYFCGVKYSPINEKDFGLYVSCDKLGSIDKVFGGLIYDLVSDNDENLYALDSTGGCKKSTDGGKNWINFSGGLPENTYASYITIDNDQYLYIGMENHKVFRTVLPVSNPLTTIDHNLKGSVSLHPNPVEGYLSVTISTNEILSGHYKIIDLNGIEKLKGEFKANQFTVDCASLPNGMAYIQVFGAGKFYCSEKFVVAH